MAEKEHDDRELAAAIGAAVAVALRQRQSNGETTVYVDSQHSVWRMFGRSQQMRGSLHGRNWGR